MSTDTRLGDRRSLVVGDRFYEMGTEDGRYPASGFHTRGEMGGFWSQPIKLLDGLWFNLDGDWLSADSYTSGWGYQRMDMGTHDGVRVTRTDVAPDDLRAGLVGLRLDSDTARTVQLSVDAHSELMKVYPWGETQPSQTTYNLPDSGAFEGGNLVFRETGRPPGENTEEHDYAAVVGSSLTPSSHELGPDHRGPQDPAVVCPASGPNAPPQPEQPCDDTAYGKGTGGRLTYSVDVPAGGRTVWFAVAGSDNGVGEASAAHGAALADPMSVLRRTVAARRDVGSRTVVDLPGDRRLQQSVEWSKQNLAESVQEARGLQVRTTNAGTRYPPPKGTVPKARWIGAGWPDYPWLFATDGEYSGFAAVAAGQFPAIEDHLRALRDVSLVANGDSGKVVHEVTPDGQVYFGANDDPGNTDETAKFPSAVALVWRWTGDDRFRDEMYSFAVSNMRYIYRELDSDGDGWPEGLGNVERNGMGEEKLDNTVYTIRGLRDLADLAASKGDQATRSWADSRAQSLENRFEDAWWFGPTADQYADSLDDPGDQKVFQRHWIGVTPVEAEIPRNGTRTGPLASTAHARALVAKREESCYSGEFGLFHTGDAGCDSATSSVPAEKTVFTLNTSIMAVAEAAIGRMAPSQLQRYTTANARVQLDPSVWELPGAMPEISPSPDFGANIERKFTERSMALQAWGTYGILWPVVHYQLGVAPDVGRQRLTVVPQVPDGQSRVAGSNIRLGSGSVGVEASRSATTLTTTVDRSTAWRLTIGATLPSGTRAQAVTLDGRRVPHQTVTTPRGTQVRVDAGERTGTSTLVVTYR
ncbi:MAG: glycogen debranching protein [Nocardioidaceae bacterium]|nr:glycogen debranching protein [Nocardioidaceae bacterium]NUS50503.1 glycogen debranching protein [Nocardioidaceae bacterium]